MNDHTDMSGPSSRANARLNRLSVQTGDWATLGQDASAIRAKVFIVEQGIPKELEWDAEDRTCVHALARDPIGRPVGTGRLLPAHEGMGRIGRMAVLRDARGHGIGGAVLEALADVSLRRGDVGVTLHAQESARAFYSRLGFVAEGPGFEEAGIPHVTMTRLHGVRT